METNRNTQNSATAQQDLFKSNTLRVNTPKEYRFLNAIVDKAVSREDLDCIVGATNSPHIAYVLRNAGWLIKTERMPVINRDGEKSRIGYYHLEPQQKQAAIDALQAYKGIEGVNHAGE